MTDRAKRFSALATAVASAVLLGSCGGGGGGGQDPGPCIEDCNLGVFSGFRGNLDFESGGDGSSGVGAGADGDGGVGAGGDFGQFRNVRVTVYRADGTLLGSALTDNTSGMVTIRAGRRYNQPLLLELAAEPGANSEYYEEGRNAFVPFPPNRKIRVVVPAITRNIGITPFTEAAYRLLTEGSTGERASNVNRPTPAEIRAANERVRLLLNQQFPTLLHVDDITRLPFIKSTAVTRDQIDNNPRGRYGIVNGAFSKQASVHDGDRVNPTLDATEQLARDLLDGQLDGRNGNQPAVNANQRTYDPNTLTGELTAALAEQAARFGKQAILDTLPEVVNYGNVRYEGYLFDGSISKDGEAHSTVTGWVAGNDKNFRTGQEFDRLPGQRAMTLFGNSAHGGGFYKADRTDGRHRIFAIGDNVNGELGLGTADSTLARALEVPAFATLPAAVTHIAGGFAHTVVRLANGSVYTWGDNSYGQLGNGSTGARSLTPVQVTLPAAAVAVAATNVATYALLTDGTVWAWGSNGGFGLLGNGQADGVLPSPNQVAGLSDIVQITARDNDVAALKRDNTIWHWGSFPADANAFVPGNPAAPYVGGTRTPQQLAGLPAGSVVRKILTEQSLFAAHLANGHVYTWGVYFDITAGQILRDTTAQRVLGLPPVRDIMPGGFIGYGVRAFDRMTAMGVDYSGGMWKIRGRVAEVYDPATEATRGAQRRPQGQGPRLDCQACHIFLEQNLVQLRAASQQPTTGPFCGDPGAKVPPSSAHAGLNGSLIHAETECIQCHNPARLNQPVNTPSGNNPFAASGGWPDCAKPTTLPNRTGINPPLLSNSCEIPPNHVFTPPGTVCASCHNSVVARPLSDANCAQPKASELPTIATVATVTGLFDDAGGAIAAGALTRDNSPEVRGTISVGLQAGQLLAVYRNGARLGAPDVVGGGWRLIDNGAPDGPATYTARVVDLSGGFGARSNAVSVNIDATPPSAQPSVASFADDALGAIAPGGFASDTTPAISGNLGGTLGAGESIQVLRNGAVVGTANISGTTWNFGEPSALAAGTYSYRVRTIDAAGNIGTTSAPAQLTIVGTLATVVIADIVNDASAVIPNGGTTTDNTPTIRGAISGTMPAGHVVRVYRGGTPLGVASITGGSWSFTDPGAADGSYTYLARVEAGAVLGALAPGYGITIDTAPPTQIANVTGISDSFNGLLPNNATTADTTPIASGSLTAALAPGERVRVLRNGVQAGIVNATGTTWTFTEPAVLANATYTYSAQVIDGAGLLGPTTGGTQTVTINAGAVPLANAATTISTVNGVAPVSNAVPVNSVTTPTIAGTIQRALNAGEAVRIYRGLNGAAPVSIANANVTGTSWTYTSGALADGSYVFRAQIEQIGNPTVFGQSSPGITVPIDATPPAQTVAITAIRDDASTLYADGGFTTDTTPQISGTLNPGLAPGEVVQVLRGGLVFTATVTGTTWSYTEPSALPGGAYTYTARVRDAAGNNSPASAARVINVVTNLPTTTITAINGSATSPLNTNDSTPTLSISLSATLPPGYVVRVLRGGVPITTGAASCTGTSCTFTDSLGATAGTTYNYTARTEAGGSATVVGTAIGETSNTRSIFLDTVAPDAPGLSGTANNKPYQNSTSDSPVSFGNGATVADGTPQIVVTFTALTAGEQVVLQRWNGSTWAQVGSAFSGSSITYNQPNALNTPDQGQPSGASTSFYRAIKTDAAGNSTTGPNNANQWFEFTNDYLACSQARALTKNPANLNPTHGSWPAGTAQCTACHSTAGPAGFIGAPPPGGLDRYWCRKS